VARVAWTPQSLADLDAICLFIARDAPEMASIFADRVFRATDRLAEHPRSGRVVPEMGQERLREIILGNYRIVYRLVGEDVQVLTVHHGARLLDTGALSEDS
jgi:plasmid stabilization system protein ParE